MYVLFFFMFRCFLYAVLCRKSFDAKPITASESNKQIVRDIIFLLSRVTVIIGNNIDVTILLNGYNRRLYGLCYCACISANEINGTVVPQETFEIF